MAVEGHGGVQHGRVDGLAFAGFLPVHERAQNTNGGVQAGHHVGHRDGRAHGAAAGLIVGQAAGAHGPGQALQDEVISGFGRIRPGLAKPGDRAVNQPGLQAS